MTGPHERPRRKHTARARLTHEPEQLQSSKREHGIATREALDLAGYVSDMSAQLEAMALSANLDLLAYFLGMARSEADLFIRTNSEAEGEGEDGEGEDGGLADEGQADFDSDS